MSDQTLEHTRILGATEPRGPETRIKLYDFYRPDKFSKEQIRILSMIHETFANLMAIHLSRTLKTMVKTEVDLVDQMTFKESMHEVDDPSSLMIYGLQPLKGSALLEVERDLSFAMLDRLTGGSGVPEDLNREFTDLEGEILSKIGGDFCKVIDNSWSAALDMRSRFVQLETMSKFAQIVPPTEMIILVRFAIESPKVKSRISMIYPYLTLEPIIDRLSARYWYQAIYHKERSANRRVTENLMLNADIRLKAEPMNLAALRRLKPGDALSISGEQLRSPSIYVNGSPVLRCAWKEPDFDSPAMLIPQEAAKDALEPSQSETGGDSVSDAIEKAFSEVTEKFSSEFRRLEKRLARMDEAQELEDLSAFRNVHAEFGDFSVAQGEYLHAVLQEQYPQIQAAILSQLSNPLAADYISRLEGALRLNVMRRISDMGSCQEWVMMMLADFLRQRIQETDSLDFGGGIEKTVEILNYVPAAVEKDVILAWEKLDPEYCEELKNRMFVFEDLTLLDERTMQKLLEQCPLDDFALAIKQIDETVTRHIKSCIGEADYGSLIGRSAELGPVRQRDVDAARLRIIEVLKEMDQSGEVVVARPGEMVE
jgi:flagellar motor switch protein FliM